MSTRSGEGEKFTRSPEEELLTGAPSLLGRRCCRRRWRRWRPAAARETARRETRILPSEMPRLPPLPRGGQRQWRTLLEDEVRRKRGFFFPDAFLLLLALFQTSSSAAHLFPLLPNATREKIKHPLREEDIPLEIRAIMNRLREAGEFGFALIFLRKTSK